MLTQAIYDVLAGDATLGALLGVYRDLPAIFTTDPAPDDEELKDLAYIVTAGQVVDTPEDTKTSESRDLWRDVRCYAPDTGRAVTVEAIAERVRTLLHRQPLTIEGFTWVWSMCAGPIVADEEHTYGRVVTVQVRADKT